MNTNQKVVRAQLGALLSRPAPPGPADERATVEQAATEFAARYPAALAAVRKLPCR